MYFWPGMFNDIKPMISACRPCSLNESSLPKNLRSTFPPSFHLGPPMAHIGIHLFNFSGKSHLVCVDRWSGYPMFEALGSTSTASIIKTLQSWFNILGWPRFIRSHRGPQFCGEFLSFCEKFGIKHELASPYNPRSNGLAESGVKIVNLCFRNAWGRERTFSEFSISGEICRNSTATPLLSLCWGGFSSCCFPSRPVIFSL